MSHSRRLSLAVAALLVATLPARAAPITIIAGLYDVVTHDNTASTITLSVSNPAAGNAVGYTPINGNLTAFFTFDSVPSPIKLTLDPAHPATASLTTPDPSGDFILIEKGKPIPFGLTEPGKLVVDPMNFRAFVEFDALLKLPPGDPTGGVVPPPAVDFSPLFGGGVELVLEVNNELIQFTGGPTPTVTITDRPGLKPFGFFEIGKVPEPGSVLLWGLAAVAGGAIVRLRRRRHLPRT